MLSAIKRTKIYFYFNSPALAPEETEAHSTSETESENSMLKIETSISIKNELLHSLTQPVPCKICHQLITQDSLETHLTTCANEPITISQAKVKQELVECHIETPENLPKSPIKSNKFSKTLDEQTREKPSNDTTMDDDSHDLEDSQDQEAPKSSDVSIYKCFLCSFVCQNKSSIKHHLGGMHYEKQIIQLFGEYAKDCLKCGRSIPNKNKWMHHLVGSHQALDRVAPKEKLSQILCSSKKLVNKTVSPTRSKESTKVLKKIKFSCQICPKQTDRKYRLSIHYCQAHFKDRLMVHFGVKKNSCATCDKAFRNESWLLFHIYKTHDTLQGLIPNEGTKLIPQPSAPKSLMSFKDILAESSDCQQATKSGKTLLGIIILDLVITHPVSSKFKWQLQTEKVYFFDQST